MIHQQKEENLILIAGINNIEATDDIRIDR